MALKVAIFILALGLFLFMGMALLNVEAQREKVEVLTEGLAKLQAGGAGPGTAGAAASGGRLATFDGTTPVLFDAANASSSQAVAVPGDPGGDIQLAVVTVTGVEGANGALVPLSSPAVLVQKGVAQEVRGGCSVEAPPTAAWVLSLQGPALQVQSRDCVGSRGGLRPLLKVTVFR
jgi:hypothetical protein